MFVIKNCIPIKLFGFYDLLNEPEKSLGMGLRLILAFTCYYYMCQFILSVSINQFSINTKMAHGEWRYVATLLLFEMTNIFFDLVHRYG